MPAPAVYALDLSFAVGDAAWWQRRAAEGARFAYFDAFTGGPRTSLPLRTALAANPPAARASGLSTGLYTNVAPWHGDGSEAIVGASFNAGDEFDTSLNPVLVIDCEIGYDQSAGWLREGLIQEAINAGRRAGFRVAVYTAAWWVNWMAIHYGHVPYFDAPIIYARYDGVAEIGDPGFFTHGQLVVGKQYSNAHLDGLAVDHNVLDPDFFLATGEEDLLSSTEYDQLDARLKSVEAAIAQLQSPPPPPPPPPPRRTYTVQAGDTLSGIAQELGVAPWQRLYDANRGLIGGDPNRIYPGMVLQVP